MLKYTGDFKKLLEMGFYQEEYTSWNGNIIHLFLKENLIITKNTRDVDIKVYFDGGYSDEEIYVDDETLEVLYDLIKRGLVKKEK